MTEEEDNQIGAKAAQTTRGCVVAAAGCGKTQQVARATALSSGRRLILTHTHAGVDALRARLRKEGVPSPDPALPGVVKTQN